MPRPRGSVKIQQAYKFLVEAEKEGRAFTREELRSASGWSDATLTATLSKKLSRLVQKDAGGLSSVGVANLTEEAFARVCSQSAILSDDPQRPRLPVKVEGLVIKAREAALAGVQHYNNPTALFRTGNYIVLMTIAYTSLFHAILERDGVDYIVRDKDGNPKLVGGEEMLWDITKAVATYEGGKTTAMTKNLEVLLPLRHKIEHRFMPEIDPDVAGHCQAMLLNFERVLVKEFTTYYSLNTSLAMALQFSTARPPTVVDAMRRMHSEEYEVIKRYLDDFHTSLPDEIMGDPAFAFRMWLIPKPVAAARANDIAIEFVSMKDATSQQLEALEQSVVAIKTREVIGDPAEKCDLWEADVVNELKKELGEKVKFRDQEAKITGPLVRMVVKNRGIVSPSDMYYRPKKLGSRAMYGRALVDLIIAEYRKDQDFFTNSSY